MIAKVIVELSNKNIDKTFDYLVPKELESLIKVGIRVCVPFGNQTLEGFVLEISNKTEQADLKEIISIIDEDIILNKELLELGKYMQSITLSTLISCYQTMLPSALKAKNGRVINKKMDTYIILGNIDNIKLNSKQEEIVNYIKDKKKVLKKELSEISVSSLNTLISKGILKEEKEEVYRVNNTGTINEKKELTNNQLDAVNKIMESKDLDKVFLLHGVTGSGKTEVYMEVIERLLSLDKESIVLVPEISLTEQMVNRFKNRFSDIAILHSRLSDGEKYDEYRRIARGEVKIVIGARSAIFAPLTNLGVIIIDEEHSDTYKQDSANPKYNAIDIAKWRSNYHKCPVILGSATPTLESYARSKKGLYELIELKTRINGKNLPNIEIIDMNKELRNKKGSFSKPLIDAIGSSLSKNEQVILLLNRRGYSSFVTCKNCGYTEKCPNCDISLTYHKSSNTLRCHYCGYGTKLETKCPNCKEDAMSNLGTGTEKIEEELNKLFPDKKIVRMDFDTTSKKGSHERIIKSFENHEYDILLGTQMIAKGLDFPNVTLVGVINADTSLNIPDFRSAEVSFDLLCQVAGRSGRGDKEGKVIIQTFNKDHYAINYAKTHDYIGFYNTEMDIRRKLSYPPYYYLVSIKVISKDYDVSRDISNKVGIYLRNNLDDVKILGPSVAGVFKLNNTYRFQIIIKYKKCDNIYKVINDLIEHYKSNSKVKIDVDFNPIHI